MSSEFCSLTENASSYYCKAVEILGPVPPQFEIVYLIGFFAIIFMFILVIVSPIIFGRMLGGRSR